MQKDPPENHSDSYSTWTEDEAPQHLVATSQPQQPVLPTQRIQQVQIQPKQQTTVQIPRQRGRKDAPRIQDDIHEQEILLEKQAALQKQKEQYATLSGLVGVHDIVNPFVPVDPTSPIAGMPVIQCWTCKLTIVVKRGKGTRCAGVKNPLFFKEMQQRKHHTIGCDVNCPYKVIQYFPDSVLMAGVPQEVDKDWFRHLD
ncbi:MAG: hypothetical protein EZS28_007666 [Streblomastix strix]|uniref:proton-translocating NAD(P)(+) transhydrogenase n=1 Tax=Streblomastix strix TaxID=222440 RepID=A0A5J4WPA7_9EUKA|nr:MAG: hypothetical protein EZS28_007666 [Streblomastix strix]